jgi:hypothetical protein
LRLLKPGATPEEIEAMAAEMTQTEPVRQARMLNA